MMKNTKQVWLVLDSRNFGGIETHVLQLARNLVKHHIPVEVVFLADYGGHPITTLFDDEQIKYRVLTHGLWSLNSMIRTQRPTLIHTHGYKAGIVTRLANILSNTTVVSTFHAGEIVGGKLAFYDFIDRVSACLSHAIIAVSAPINARLDNRATILNNFVAINQQHLPGDQIAFVGRLSHEKGPDIFLKLASYFTEQHFHVYGDGPMADELKRHAGDNVIFHGDQPSMDHHWKNIGLLVMPSRQEGLPMAALEAMSHGIPVCAFNVGALHKLINQRNGWLAPAGDTRTLKHAICQWLSSSLAHKFSRSRHARKRIIVKFSDVAAMPMIVDCYNNALVSNNCRHLQFNPRIEEPCHGTY